MRIFDTTGAWGSKRALLGSIAMASVVMFACASNVTPPSEAMPDEFAGAPDWVVRGCDGLEGDRQICGVGSMGGTNNISLARTTAVARGRTEIARTLETRVKAMLKDYQSTTTGGQEFRNAAVDEQHIEDVSKQITDFSLSGTEMKELWISRSGTVYAVVVLDVEKFTDSVSKMKTLSNELRAAIEERARASFEELGDEIQQERLSRR